MENDKTASNSVKSQKSELYQIQVESHLDSSQWERWFDNMTMTQQDDGTTILEGKVVDQSALFGLLKKVRDLGLCLIRVERIP